MFEYNVSGEITRPSDHIPGQTVCELFSCKSMTADRRIIMRDLRKWYGQDIIVRFLKIQKGRYIKSYKYPARFNWLRRQIRRLCQYCLWIGLDSPDGNSDRTLKIDYRFNGLYGETNDLLSWKKGERPRLERFLDEVCGLYPQW